MTRLTGLNRQALVVSDTIRAADDERALDAAGHTRLSDRC
jgi:hypothetical protein